MLYYLCKQEFLHIIKKRRYIWTGYQMPFPYRVALEMDYSISSAFRYLYNKIIIMISNKNIILYNLFSLCVIISLLPRLPK